MPGSRKCSPGCSCGKHRGGTLARFWSKVNKNGPVHPTLGTRCWLWTAARNKPGGYGVFRLSEHHAVCAHVYAYELLVGTRGIRLVDHRCHDPGCVNPTHLRLADKKQNAENMAGLRVDNTSGFRGVHRAGRRWAAVVQHHGHQYRIGTFDTAEEADAAASARRRELFTHNDRDRQ